MRAASFSGCLINLRCRSHMASYEVRAWRASSGHCSAGAVLQRRKAFQQTERRPAAHGLLGPLNLTARCRSAMLDPSLNVSSHRDLGCWV